MRSTGHRARLCQSLSLQSWGVQKMMWASQTLQTSNDTPRVLATASETDQGKAFCSPLGFSNCRSISSLSTMLRITVRAMTSKSGSSVARSANVLPQIRLNMKAFL